MVCKRYTYAYGDFVRGLYAYNGLRNINIYEKNELMALFNEMTVDEKLSLLSLDFQQIWYKVWLDTPKRGIYYSAQVKFNDAWLQDNGARLIKLISKSNHGRPIWEIPKGRKKSKFEPDVMTGLREFTEETNIEKSAYKLTSLPPMSYSYTDRSVTYLNTYYIATTLYDFEPQISFNTYDQITEVLDIKWMDIDNIRVFDDKYKQLYPFVKNIFHQSKSVIDN